MLSRRTAWDLAGNRLSSRLEALRAAGRPLLDLSEANPTRCGLGWSAAELGAALADPRVSDYEPTPQGLPAAREAVAAYLAGHGAAVPPERILLTSSTSEAYALLFKLLCDPGDEVLVPSPSYPLLDLLAGLESVALRRYPLRYDGEWHLDRAALAAAVGPRTRAVVAVSPSNPTGWLLDAGDLAFLEALAGERGLALLGDEVFADTALAPRASAAGARGCLAFHLSGLSKVCGLPQLKAGWIAAAGPEPLVAPALARLEVVADTWLSVSGPAQLALPALLGRRERFLGPLRERLGQNRRALASEAEGAPFDLLRSGGGWSAVLRLGEAVDEEALCLALLEDGVVAQPGFFYDFERNGHLVISLLPEPGRFKDGISRIGARLRYKRAQ
ncbi:pyridoxal phosphate-dependent aminotransferase [Anaeromyxobacter paludicola]|uniref:Aminotransferase n=1 Tax=Anaeromyxobacter paludicola TaxID=2918171 RepID=A0ABM7XFF5_9BACT|nr:pyridoxal phosphate-dependent aminotransferase [Anaeromyxobacter paludicola]BDG10628.1 aminotransferase [Anaeromyxobacter paludicola]